MRQHENEKQVVKAFWRETASQRDFGLGKFNVTLDCFKRWFTACGEIPTPGPM